MNEIYRNKKDLFDALINKNNIVLDVGFWGQGMEINDNDWPHRLLKEKSKEVYGLDLHFNESGLENKANYKIGNAEDFDFNIKFDVIFAGDLIEHLSNPGLFLQSCYRNLKNDGRLIITTPNCFNLFHLTEKITKKEPTVNPGHTCYFNWKTLKVLLEKNNWQVNKIGYLYSLKLKYKESWKKKILNIIYFLISKITPKFLETLVIIASKNENILSDIYL